MKKILNNQIGMKFGFVLFLFVLLQIPMSMVSGLVSERSYRQQEVRDEILIVSGKFTAKTAFHNEAKLIQQI